LKGPKFLYLYGSSELAQAAIVLPQKLPLANKIVALSAGTFFASYPHLLANLIALYPASTPEFIRRDLS